MRSELSSAQKECILVLHQEGLSNRRIATHLSISEFCVRYNLKNLKENGTMVNKTRSGRPKAMTLEQESALIARSKEDPTKPATQLKLDLEETFGHVASISVIKKFLSDWKTEMADLLEWRRHWKPDLKAAKWAPCRYKEKTLLVKSHFADETYQIMVYDGLRMWQEQCDKEQFQQRTKTLNPNIEAPLGTLLHHLQDSVSEENMSHSISKLTQKEDAVTIHMATQLEGALPFTWQFHLKEALHEESAEHLTTPLMSMVAELLRRQKELFRILKRKDAEIDDYKASGAKVSRKHLETTPFDDKIFINNMNESKEFGVLVDPNQSTSAFQESGQDLYRQIKMRDAFNNAQLIQEDSDEEYEDDFSGVGDAPTAPSGPSWRKRLPPSLVEAAQTGTNQSPDRVSPKKSPRMSSPGSSTQDTEMMRRQALEKKLAEEQTKLKAKKKKRSFFESKQEDIFESS
ncbi:uncharacterized protein [Amphiura filiformis]|uniref:uncharacterized protein isoform X2 n=1 Tax=Amphiura filiformis TaxID=82378 RepID=UPI003B20BE6A